MATPISIDKGLAGQFSEFGNSATPNKVSGNDLAAKLLAESQQKQTQEIALQKSEQEKSPVVNEEIEQEEIKSAIEIIAGFINVAPRSVNFQQHEDSEKTIIKVFDNDTQELIRQFPSEEVLEIAKKIVALREDVGRKTGILLDEKI